MSTKPAAGSDRHQTRDRAGREAEHAGVPMAEPGGGHPGEPAHRGGGVGDHDRVRRQSIRAESAAAVEPEPAEPEETGAEHRIGQVVWLQRVTAEADALAEHARGDQRRHARGDVDDGAAGEVERAVRAQPTADAPDPVRDRGVDEGRPEQAEDGHRLEALTLGERAGDERRGDDGEHHLERHEREGRDRRRVVGVRLLSRLPAAPASRSRR